jgi:hypothetical protein
VSETAETVSECTCNCDCADSKLPSLTSTPTASLPATPALPAIPAASAPMISSSANGAGNGNGNGANGHDDLHLDRRKLARAVEVAGVENRVWADSGWWAGGAPGWGV